ncbi:MAG: BTAD domain-containing putative transcriptional regulator [Acidimicrobiales bacterium]
MDIRLFGTTEVAVDGVPRALGGPRQRSVLSDLALHAGRVVQMSELIDDLWGDSPPDSASHTVETYVSRLRRVLHLEGQPSVLVTGGSGYLLNVAPEHVDALHFGELAARGRAALERGDALAAEDLLSAALALWRGAALADVQDSVFAPAAARRLENDRVAALESLMDARLLLGQHRELVSELERAIALDPYRERFHAQLMLALYRSGRQADALAAYQSARIRLREDLGIDPGRELRELERAILVQAPELEAPSGVAVFPTSPPRAGEDGAIDAVIRAPGPRRRALRNWRVRTLTVAAVPVLVAAVAVPLLTRSPQPGVATIGLSELTAAGSLARSISLPSEPGSALSADGSVWLTSPVTHALYRLDPVTGNTEDTIMVGAGADAIAATGSDVWVANTLDGTVSRVSTATDGVVETVTVGPEPTGLASGDGSVWVADASASTLTAVNATSGLVTSTEPLGSPPFGAAFGAGSVWVTSPGDNNVTRVQPGGGPSVELSVGAEPTAITFGLGSVWVADQLDGTVTRIDPGTDSVLAEIPVGNGPNALAVADGYLWVANSVSSTVTRIDPATNTASPAVPVKDDPLALASYKDGLWVATGAPATGVAEGGTLRVVTGTPEPSIDPALTYPELPHQFFEGTYDGLMNYDQVGGSDGLQVVPNLALAMPSVTSGGTLYTFVLRPGIRYSDGRLVQPADFRRAIERTIVMNPSAAFFLDGIVGASSCRTGRPCNLDQGITVSDNPETVTFHLVAPDADFLYKLTLEFTAPVPPGTPTNDVGTHPVPSTGPYMIGHYVPNHEIEFVRNPFFHVWSAAAEPAGVPDRIIWTYGATIPEEVTEVEKGQADWEFDTVPDVAGLIAEYPGQVHVNPLLAFDYAAFNVRTPPFNDLRVRQAFSLAANRAQLVADLGGPNAVVPTCQILPPGMPGYRPYCPFTVDPNPEGTWVGPNLALARKLVAESGTKGMRVVLWGHEWDEPTGAFIVSVLRELGYRASMVIRSDQVLGVVLNQSRDNIQVTDGWWGPADYPEPSDILDFLFRCSSSRLDDPTATRNGDFFCDPAIDRLMDVADREDSADPAAALLTWAKVDRDVTDAAPWVSLAAMDEDDFMSARVSNYQYNPVFGILLDQLSVRRS